MGWGSGSGLMADVIKALREGKRVEMFKELITAFEDMDCDTLQECLGMDPDFDKAYHELHPNEDED